MTFQIECEKCRARLTVRAEQAGKRCKCPQCGAAVTVSTPVIPVEPPAEETTYDLAPPSAGGGSAPGAGSRAARNALAEKLQSPNLAPGATNARAAGAPPEGRQSPPTPAELQQRWQRLHSALTGSIEPVRTTLAYRAWSVAAALTMLVAPAIYVAFIALAALAVFYHASAHLTWFRLARGRGLLLIGALYAAPIFAGLVMILFLVKPLFARPAHFVRSRSLTRHSDPVLFAFVDRLCQAIRAPAPCRIHVDCDMNASAGYERGWRGMFDGRLSLTLGMPLAAGLNVEQFGAVIAHELGHFTQHSGMRLTYVVRSISAWFVRVVYERDEWDVWLAHAHQDLEWWLALIVLLAQGCVKLGRGLLWLLMHGGIVVSGFLLRQMEYDADLHAIRFAGSRNFHEMQLRLRLLGAAASQAEVDLLHYLTTGRLPDNLARLIQARVAQLSPEAVQQELARMRSESASWWSTHPSDGARLDAAARANAPGIFHCPGPSAVLFTDFEGLCRNVTWDWYRGLFGVHFNPAGMDSTEALLAREQAQAR